MVLGKTKNKKRRKRNSTTRRKKKKGGEYSKIAKLLLKKKRSKILENTANDTIKHSDIRTDKHPKRKLLYGYKELFGKSSFARQCNCYVNVNENEQNKNWIELYADGRLNPVKEDEL